MLQLNQPYYHVTLTLRYSRVYRKRCGNVISNTNHEVLSANSKGGLEHIHGGTKQKEPPAGLMPRQRSRARMLVNVRFHANALLRASGLWIENNISY
jgi:hypothetical protein